MQNYPSFIVLIKKYQCKRTTKSKQQRKIKTKLYDKRDDFTFPMVKFLIHQYYYCSSASVWSFHFKTHTLSGADPGFQVRGAHLKKLRRTEGARKFLGYFVWKITILRQKNLFLPIAEGGAKMFGVFRVKNHDFTPKNHIFSNFRGAHPPWLFYDLYTLQWFSGQNPAADVITTHLWLRCSCEIV